MQPITLRRGLKPPVQSRRLTRTAFESSQGQSHTCSGQGRGEILGELVLQPRRQAKAFEFRRGL